jgi:hypothetical protein
MDLALLSEKGGLFSGAGILCQRGTKKSRVLGWELQVTGWKLEESAAGLFT